MEENAKNEILRAENLEVRKFCSNFAALKHGTPKKKAADNIRQKWTKDNAG